MECKECAKTKEVFDRIKSILEINSHEISNVYYDNQANDIYTGLLASIKRETFNKNNTGGQNDGETKTSKDRE